MFTMYRSTARAGSAVPRTATALSRHFPLRSSLRPSTFRPLATGQSSGFSGGAAPRPDRRDRSARWAGRGQGKQRGDDRSTLEEELEGSAGGFAAKRPGGRGKPDMDWGLNDEEQFAFLHPERKIAGYRRVISEWAAQRLPDRALAELKKMRADGCEADEATYSIVIEAFVQHATAGPVLEAAGPPSPEALHALENAEALLLELEKEGVPVSFKVYESVIDGWAAIKAERAEAILNKLEKLGPDYVSFRSRAPTYMGFLQQGDLGRAQEQLKRIYDSEPNLPAATSLPLIHTAAQAGKFDVAEKELLRLEQRGDAAGQATPYNLLLLGLTQKGEFGPAEKLFGEMEKKGSPPDALSHLIFIVQHVHRGQIDQARRWFATLKTTLGTPAGVIYRAIFTALEDVQDEEALSTDAKAAAKAWLTELTAEAPASATEPLPDLPGNVPQQVAEAMRDLAARTAPQHVQEWLAQPRELPPAVTGWLEQAVLTGSWAQEPEAVKASVPPQLAAWLDKWEVPPEVSQWFDDVRPQVEEIRKPVAKAQEEMQRRAETVLREVQQKSAPGGQRAAGAR